MQQKPDNDTLDIAGDWNATFSVGVGLPVRANITGLIIHFDIVGPGDHGGVKFKGKYPNIKENTVAGNSSVFLGETYYDHRGVQILQFLQVGSDHHYLAIMCGKHEKDLSDPAKVLIVGGWTDVGNFAGRGEIGNFEMVKILKNSRKSAGSIKGA